jgi:hypothetical protein
MATDRYTRCTSDIETPFGKIESITNRFAYPVKRNPFYESVVNATLQNHITYEAADGIVGKRRHYDSAHSEAFAQPAGYVIFTSALPGTEMAGGMNPFKARIKSKHDFLQG